MTTPVTLDEIYRQMIADIAGAEPTDSTLRALLLALGLAIAGGGGGGGVGSVTNTDGNLTISPTTGAVVANLSTSFLAVIALKATLASPAFTGTPTAPTPSPGDNTTKVATTAFVTTAVGESGVSSFNGRTGTVVPASGDYTVSEVTGAAPVASPALTGTPTVPTATPGDNTTKAASTAFVTNAVAESTTGVSQVTNVDGSLTISPTTGAVVASASTSLVASIAAKAPLASPALSGTPTAPTATGGTNTTQIATTAYVIAALAALTLAQLQAPYTAAGQIIYATGTSAAELITLYTVAQSAPSNFQTGSYAPVLSDRGKVITIASASAVTVTLNEGIFSNGDNFAVCQFGAGEITFAAGTGVTITSLDGLTTTGEGAFVSVWWNSPAGPYLVGNLS
jgi:hypothetical protein